MLVIGGKAGSFLGEYQAGGVIIVLNMQNEERPVWYFPCTGMHGGKVFIRSGKDVAFPPQVRSRIATEEDISEIENYIEEYCLLFGGNEEEIKKQPFTVVTPNSNNPYKQLYVRN